MVLSFLSVVGIINLHLEPILRADVNLFLNSIYSQDVSSLKHFLQD